MAAGVRGLVMFLFMLRFIRDTQCYKQYERRDRQQQQEYCVDQLNAHRDLPLQLKLQLIAVRKL